jgi:uncharacterized membrane protein SpoIIM required for sporulation
MGQIILIFFNGFVIGVFLTILWYEGQKEIKKIKGGKNGK